MRLALVLLMAHAVACRGDRSETPSSSTTPPSIEKTNVDEPTTNEEDILIVPVAHAAAGLYELHFGKGRALLSLDRGTFVAPDPASGALALEVLAKWLGVPVPPKTHMQPLRPLTFEAMDFGDNKYKVFFKRGAEYAEMYINIRDERHLEFVPKDEDYAGALVDMFADALRDGPAPARTKQTDPSLETDEARYAIGHEVDAAGGHEPRCLGDGWFVFRPTNVAESAWFARWGARPAKVCELPGAVDGVAQGARSAIAVAIVTARDPNSHVVGGKQTATLWTVGPLGCHAIATPKDLTIGPFTDVHLSPTGTEVVITDNGSLITLPVEKGKPTRTPIADMTFVYAWDDDGIQLHDLQDNRTRVVGTRAPVKIDHHSTISPDRGYRITLGDASLDVLELATNRARTFKPAFRSDIRAIQRAAKELPPWIASHSLVLRGSPDLVLDALTLRTRPLSDPAAGVICASANGEHALMQQGDVLYESK